MALINDFRSSVIWWLEPNLQDTYLTLLKRSSFERYKSTLEEIFLFNARHLTEIEPRTFSDLKHLRTIYIRQAATLESVDPQVFSTHLNNLNVLRIVHSGLKHPPTLQQPKTKNIMKLVDFDSNKIESVPSGSFEVETEQLNLEYNRIEYVDAFAFRGSKIGKLSLKWNKMLTKIHEDAFVGLEALRELDLSHTSIVHLPTAGLDKMQHQINKLWLQHTETLKVFPPVYSLGTRIKEAHLTYPYHCCAFHYPKTHNPEAYASHLQLLERIRKSLCPPPVTVSPSYGKYGDITGVVRQRRGRREISPNLYETDYSEFADEPRLGFDGFYHQDGGDDTPIIEVDGEIAGQPERPQGRSPSSTNPGHTGFGKLDSPHPSDPPLEGERPAVVASPGGGFGHATGSKDGKFFSGKANIENYSKEVVCGNVSMNYEQVQCDPRPDAFNPCEDVMGNAGLRVAVWLVVVAAVLGNVAVMFVLMSSRFKMTVSKFLMCNLAFSDFCTGLYLMVIASMDLHTLGEYFNHAIDWQRGPGCQVAGFLTVFGSELSIFTLTVITLERWYAITYAIHLNRRLRLGTAARVMIGGWIYAITLACLPLFGVSGYAKTSICLPFDNENSVDVAYITGILSVNGLAFLLICACYGKMYWAIGGGRRHSSAVTQGDKTVAKRMALLVFTDFACWAPIAFFGLTAVAGYPLISVTNSKILLVFFYPLNSCANPFLYAIFTKQYRRDLFVMLGRYGLFAGHANRHKPNYSSNLTHIGGRAVGGVAPTGPVGIHRRGSSLLTQLSCDNYERDKKNKKKQQRHKRNGSHHSEVTTTSTTATTTPPRHTPPSPSTRAAQRSANGAITQSKAVAVIGDPKNGVDPALVDNGRQVALSELETVIEGGGGSYRMSERGYNGSQLPVSNMDNRGGQQQVLAPSPKVRGSPHPIKNSYTKLNSANSEHEILVLQKMQVFPENWTARRSASLGDGTAVEIIPLKQPELIRNQAL